jgi:signal transduction histidine kinase
MALDAARLVRFLDDLLALADATSGEMTIEPVLVHRLVAEVVLDLLATEAAPVAVTVDRVAAVPPALADPDGLRHALRNLLRHAVRTTPEDGEVRLKVTAGRTWVSVTLADRTASPVPRARPGPARHDQTVEPGGRLWLATAQALVEGMGGRMRTSVRAGRPQLRITLPTATDAD